MTATNDLIDRLNAYTGDDWYNDVARGDRAFCGTLSDALVIDDDAFITPTFELIEFNEGSKAWENRGDLGSHRDALDLMFAAIANAGDLEDLRSACNVVGKLVGDLQHNDYNDAASFIRARYETALERLPTFGGEAPSDTREEEE
jgi:hypothetical protein